MTEEFAVFDDTAAPDRRRWPPTAAARRSGARQRLRDRLVLATLGFAATARPPRSIRQSRTQV